jgi:hypothetical protein
MVSVKVKEQYILKKVINWLDILEMEFLREGYHNDRIFLFLENLFLRFYQIIFFYPGIVI